MTSKNVEPDQKKKSTKVEMSGTAEKDVRCGNISAPCPPGPLRSHYPQPGVFFIHPPLQRLAPLILFLAVKMNRLAYLVWQY
jgi:hypothetical protein